uniref:Uncharacterized protein n=1 Tax=Ditylenchus dipsaci TaxID=166011 RepID=A0A915DJH7_9BILA
MPAKGVTRSSRAKPTINKNAHVTTREIDCQTDDLDQALASDVGKLDALKKTFDSVAISSRDPNVYCTNKELLCVLLRNFQQTTESQTRK